MSLTEKAIKSAKPQDKMYRMAAGGGLYLEVRPTGAKTFTRNYRFAGKQRWDTLGSFPDMRLVEAQARSVEIAGMLKQKIDPRADLETVRRVAAEQVSEAEPGLALKTGEVPEDRRFEVVARKFIQKRAAEGIAEATLNKLNWNLGGVASKHFEGRDIGTIGAPEVLALVERTQQEGTLEKAKDIHRKLAQTFDYAIALGLVKWNPAHHVKRAVIRTKGREHPGLTDPKDVGVLMLKCRAYPDGSGQNTRAGLLLSAYTFLRSLELRGACWPEIDFDNALWTVPKERMKGDHPGDHLVPLSRQALVILEHLHAVRDHDDPYEFVFPSPSKVGRHMSNSTLNNALRVLGYDTRKDHCHHGFRTTFSTNMNEQEWNTDWIEKQLAHVERNKVRGSYNKAQYLDGRREMMQAYADWLDECAEKAQM